MAEMTNLGLPVPPGFTITTEACRYYLEQGSTPAGLDDEIAAHLDKLEQDMGRLRPVHSSGGVQAGHVLPGSGVG